MRIASRALVSVSKSIGWSFPLSEPDLTLILSSPCLRSWVPISKSACPRLFYSSLNDVSPRTHGYHPLNQPAHPLWKPFESSSISINTSTVLAFHHYACCWRPSYHSPCSQPMVDLEKLDRLCSCTLVEVVVKVSHPFTLLSERQSDNCPLLVCKPIPHTASRVLCSCLTGRRRHYLSLPRINMRALAVTWNPWQTLSINT